MQGKSACAERRRVDNQQLVDTRLTSIDLPSASASSSCKASTLRAERARPLASARSAALWAVCSLPWTLIQLHVCQS